MENRMAAANCLREQSGYLFDLCGLNRLRGGADNIDDEVGVRQHCDVTAVDSMSGRTHALRYEALQIGVDCLVLRGQNVPARFGLPGRAYHFLVEEVRSRRIVRRPDDLLLLLGKVARA